MKLVKIYQSVLSLVYSLALPISLALSLLSVSCAKTPKGVRTIKQTQGQAINPTANAQGTNAAGAQGILFRVVFVDRPQNADGKSFSIQSEIQTPDGLFIPVTTTHNGDEPAYGTIQSGQAKLDIRSKCYGVGCANYIMLVSVLVNNQLAHQIAIISNASEDFFWMDNINAQTHATQLYRGNTGMQLVDEVKERNKNLLK